MYVSSWQSDPKKDFGVEIPLFSIECFMSRNSVPKELAKIKCLLF